MQHETRSLAVGIIGTSMERPTRLRIGDWCVDPASGEIARNGETARVEARLETRSMRLLLCLANRSGEVVSIDELLNQVWPDVAVSQDSVYQAVASLRRQLGDDPKQPAYIATVPRLGYRLVAAVGPWEEVPEPASDQAAKTQAANIQAEESTAATKTIAAPQYGIRRRPGFAGNAFLRIAGATLCILLIAFAAIYLANRQPANSTPATVAAQPQRPLESGQSVAVLPFLDLTEGMKNEEFADGMTEELIDKFSKIPGLRVPPPTSSFYYKNKQVPVAEIARQLGVAYVLDGSVRKSGDMLRVAARLIRVDNGYIVWTETYDRPFHDQLMIQDDIAGEVAKALKVSIAAGAARSNR